jgi:hypothetical protein
MRPALEQLLAAPPTDPVARARIEKRHPGTTIVWKAASPSPPPDDLPADDPTIARLQADADEQKRQAALQAGACLEPFVMDDPALARLFAQLRAAGGANDDDGAEDDDEDDDDAVEKSSDPASRLAAALSKSDVAARHVGLQTEYLHAVSPVSGARAEAALTECRLRPRAADRFERDAERPLRTAETALAAVSVEDFERRASLSKAASDRQLDYLREVSPAAALAFERGRAA